MIKIEKEFITYRGGQIDRLKIKPKKLVFVLKEEEMGKKSVGKYFVLSDGDHPVKIVFSEEEARKSKPRYIDAFDETGKWVDAWKYVDNEYTHNF